MAPTFASLERFRDSRDILSMIKRAIDDANQEIGTVNVLIAGRTGVGKSTLINEIFQGRLADTGQGKPITKETRRITKRGIPLGIYDTQGLELKEYQEIIDELMERVQAQHQKTDGNEHIHVAWVCVSEDSRRVEEAEIELHSRLADYMPVLGVVTKSRADGGFRAEVQRLLPEARNVVSVRALSERFDDSDVVLPPMGLKELGEATSEVIEEAAERAFAAAQKASMDLKIRKAHKVVATAATTAAAVGAAPIPFADAAVLVPIQIGMLAGITATFGIEPSTALLRTLVASMAGTTGATLAGRAIVSSLLKFIPGVGTIAGGAISAAVASTITVSLGETYIGVLARLTASGGETPPSEAIIEQEFKKDLKSIGD